MTATYRRLNPEELPALIDLRATALGTSPAEVELVLNDFGQEPDPSQRTLVAVGEDGALLATVGYWLRERRGLDGTPQRVGHLYGVATRSDVRRHGHASRLLEHAVAAMQAEGCHWSVLFAREEARSLYVRACWHAFTAPWQYGTLAAARPAMPDGYHASLFDPRHEHEGWEQLAALYVAFNRARPLSVVRSLAYWQSYSAWMFNDLLTHHRGVVVGVRRGEEAQLCGYALVHYYDEAPSESNENWFIVSELGAEPDDPQALPAMLCAAMDEAVRRGIAKGATELPDEPALLALLELHWLSVVRSQRDGGLMARPLVEGASEEGLTALFAAPGAMAWGSDGY